MPPELKKGDKVITPLGAGVIEHFELLPALRSADPKIQLVDEIPEDALPTWEGGRTWYRVGVSGTPSGIVPVAYFNAREVAPHDDVIECALCGKELWFRDSYSPGDSAICAECDTEVTGREHAPTMNPKTSLPPWNE